MAAAPLVVLGLALLLVEGASAEVGSVSTSIEEVGSKVLLTCALNHNDTQVTGHRWMKGDKVLKEDALTDLKTEYEVDAADRAGKYSCLFLPETVGRGDLAVSGPPKVKALKRSVKGDEGDPVTLACKSDSFPPVTSWAWYKMADSGHQEIVNGSQNRFFVNNSEARSELRIKKLNIKFDPGKYVCNGTSSLGSDKAVITLRVHSRLAAFWPFLGIVMEVLVLVAIIFFYEKCRQPEVVVDDDDTGTEPPKSSGHQLNNEDKSVRQRNPT
ncbi:basigin-like [Lepus europaeus]|uniref:basigin-like n=1 Tax=Lepus europaeus TaxID=9983 RepID=UPI002B45C75D|nr:basigin-like [Lepus europaeus]